jgi:hypothetical protein
MVYRIIRVKVNDFNHRRLLAGRKTESNFLNWQKIRSIRAARQVRGRANHGGQNEEKNNNHTARVIVAHKFFQRNLLA